MKLKDTGLTAQDIKDKVKKYMIETYERFDFIAETAEGMYLYDENGTPYLDFYAGIAVNNAGSRNPKVVAAVKDQVDDIMHTFNYPYTIPQALLAEKVCETIGMDKIFFQNSGTEANEAMIKMARKYGIDAEDISKLDVQALNKAVTEDKAYYEERADELGIPVEEAMRIDQLERRNKLLERQNDQTLEQRRLQEHFDGLVQQAAKLQEMYPGFDLQTELENPVFARLTAPGSLVSVEDAYFAVHRKEIQTAAMQVAAQKTAQQISNSIQAGQRRPAENGSASQAASISAQTTMSRARRDEIKRRMRSAAANGEKLYPGTF